MHEFNSALLWAAKVTKSKWSCLPACQQTYYETSHRSVFIRNDIKSAYISIEFPNIEVEMHDEILIFDFNAIVASVGGSLGLFLGFSFFDFWCFMFEIVYTRFCGQGRPGD